MGEGKSSCSLSPLFLPHPAVGTQPRRLSHDASLSLRRSSSSLQSRRVVRGIPEAYEIKVYEIDSVQRMQNRAGAGKQVLGCSFLVLEENKGHYVKYDL